MAEVVVGVRGSFIEKPVFALTADQDWASNYCVETLLEFSREHGITPTVFVTNPCAALDAATDGDAELGIHPNFLPGSTHGETYPAVIDHVLSIVKKPIAVRSHSFFEHSGVLAEFFARGLTVDSNICLMFQRDIRPLCRVSGLTSLPCFWEDDAHWDLGFEWNFERYRSLFFTPGLKIINVHPFLFTLNIPDAAFYSCCKPHTTSLNAQVARTLRHAGPGPATFLADMIAAIHEEGYHVSRLSEVIKNLEFERIRV